MGRGRTAEEAGTADAGRSKCVAGEAEAAGRRRSVADHGHLPRPQMRANVTAAYGKTWADIEAGTLWQSSSLQQGQLLFCQVNEEAGED